MMGRTAQKPEKQTVGQAIIAGLREALAFERGEISAEVRIVPATARTATVEPAPTYSPTRVVTLRESLKLSQAVFAQALNVKPATVRSWEQGKRVPDGAAARLLQIAEEHPTVLASRVSHRPAASGLRLQAAKSVRPVRRGNRTLERGGKTQGRASR
jgi:putative transcriptional regulator